MTLLIRNVRIVGGTKPFHDPVDVFVSGERISAIGSFPKKIAARVVDGQGAYLSPGFIDVNTDSDHYLTLFDHPAQEDFLRQGVTTIFGGMCGASLAPLLYGTLESLEKWGETDRANVNWHTMAEFLKTVDRHPLAVNFGTLVGHATIRRSILAEARRDLTKGELQVFAGILRRALREGAFGLSTGLSYVHARDTSYPELKALAGVVREANGVYATHLRNAAEGIGASIDETIKLSRETGVRTLVSHFTPILGSEAGYGKALDAIEALPREADFHFDIYPSPNSLLALYLFLPLWAQNGGVEVMLANVKDEWLAARIKRDLAPIDEEHFVIAQAPGNDFLVGKNLREIKEIYGLADSRDALLRLMATMHMRGAVLYRNLSPELTKRAMKSPRSLIASNAPSFDAGKGARRLKSERTTSTFTDFLKFAEGEGGMPLEDAVAKITAAPARKFGLAGRGTIAVGNYADLTCFRGGEIRATIVNGKVAMENGEFGNLFPGKALRHG